MWGWSCRVLVSSHKQRCQLAYGSVLMLTVGRFAHVCSMLIHTPPRAGGTSQPKLLGAYKLFVNGVLCGTSMPYLLLHACHNAAYTVPASRTCVAAQCPPPTRLNLVLTTRCAGRFYMLSQPSHHARVEGMGPGRLVRQFKEKRLTETTHRLHVSLAVADTKSIGKVAC